MSLIIIFLMRLRWKCNGYRSNGVSMKKTFIFITKSPFENASFVFNKFYIVLNFFVPEGMNVVIHVYVNHRNVTVF